MGCLKIPEQLMEDFFKEKNDNSSPQHPSLVIAVDDIHESISDIKEAGGNVLNEPVEITGYGMYVSFLDTEGNMVGVMQPFQM